MRFQIQIQILLRFPPPVGIHVMTLRGPFDSRMDDPSLVSFDVYGSGSPRGDNLPLRLPGPPVDGWRRDRMPTRIRPCPRQTDRGESDSQPFLSIHWGTIGTMERNRPGS